MRNRYLDVLRAVAIVRVVIYHVTGWSALTIVFPAMPVMFALAGSLMAASIDRSGAAAIGRRLRRLLPSLWVLTAVFVPAMLLAGLAWDWHLLLWGMPLVDPPANDWGAQALSANWYLRDFLWFVLLSPAALWLFRRNPVLTVAAPYLMLLALEFTDWRPHVVLRDIGLYFGAWLLGFAHHDGLLTRLGRTRLLAIAGSLATAGGVWIWLHPGPRGYDLNDIPLGNALWAGAFILVALGCAPTAERFEGAPRWWHRPVTVLNARALTIYLWHVPILVGVTRYGEQAGWPIRDAAGVAWRLAAVVAGVVLAVTLVGWVEDVAGRRRPTLLPGRRRAARPRVDADVPARPAAASADPSTAALTGGVRIPPGRTPQGSPVPVPAITAVPGPASHPARMVHLVHRHEAARSASGGAPAAHSIPGGGVAPGGPDAPLLALSTLVALATGHADPTHRRDRDDQPHQDQSHQDHPHQDQLRQDQLRHEGSRHGGRPPGGESGRRAGPRRSASVRRARAAAG